MRLPITTAVVHLELGLDSNGERQFDAAVVSISGRDVWRQQPVNVEGDTQAPQASLWIPSELVRAGHYTVRPELHGTAVDYYSLTVLP